MPLPPIREPQTIVGEPPRLIGGDEPQTIPQNLEVYDIDAIQGDLDDLFGGDLVDVDEGGSTGVKFYIDGQRLKGEALGELISIIPNPIPYKPRPYVPTPMPPFRGIGDTVPGTGQQFHGTDRFGRGGSTPKPGQEHLYPAEGSYTGGSMKYGPREEYFRRLEEAMWDHRTRWEWEEDMRREDWIAKEELRRQKHEELFGR